MNQKIFNILFSFGNKHKKTTIFTTIFSCYLFFAMYTTGFIYILFNYTKYNIFKYIFVPLVTIIIAKIIRKILKAKRPFEKMNIKSLVYHKGGGSMPSNHSASAMVLALALSYITPHLFFVYFCLALITGISRIMAGLHYPIDVFFGFLLGFCVGILGFFII